MKIFLTILTLFSWTAAIAQDRCSATLTNGPSAVQGLLDQLTTSGTTDLAAKELLGLASHDSVATDALDNVLPKLIRDCPTDERLLNAVALAGQLRLKGTIPALISALDRGELGLGISTATSEFRLENDPVGKSLAEIGDPAIPELSKLLRASAPRTRRRAAKIPLNIGSPSSKDVLRQHLNQESDAGLRRLIETMVDAH